MKTLPAIALLLTVLNSAPTFSKAKGAGSSGGGDQATKVGSDQSVLADRYADAEYEHEDDEKNKITIDNDVVAEVDKLMSFYKKYFGNGSALRNQIFSDNIIYVNVAGIPKKEECEKRLTYKDVPADSIVEQFACTIGPRTYMVMEKFNRFSVREKALGLIHEGLRRVDASDYILASITNGLRVAVENYDLQTKGDFSQPMNKEELNILFQLSKAALLQSNNYKGTEKEYLTIKESIRLTEFGGIMNKKYNLGKTKAKIGIGANFYNSDSSEISIADSAILLNSHLCSNSGPCTIGKDVTLDSVIITDVAQAHEKVEVSINDNVEMKNVVIARFGSLEIGQNTKIKDVTLWGSGSPLTDFKIASNSILKDFDVNDCFNSTTVRFEGVIDGNGATGILYPTYPLTFSKITSSTELMKRVR